MKTLAFEATIIVKAKDPNIMSAIDLLRKKKYKFGTTDNFITKPVIQIYEEEK